jgi:hypothetical protein
VDGALQAQIKPLQMKLQMYLIKVRRRPHLLSHLYVPPDVIVTV